MKVLGILGSPHKTGGSAQLLVAALKGAQRLGAKTELVSVYDGEIKPCEGCIKDEEPYCKFPCIFEDYGKVILQKIYESDGLIFSTPVYWFAPSGQLKNLIDRMTSLENMVAYGEPSYLEGKVAAAIAVGADDGGSWATGYLVATLTSMGCIIPPWGLAYSHKREKAVFDDKALMDAINIGLLTVKTIARLNGEIVDLMFVSDSDMLEEIRKEITEELGIMKSSPQGASKI
ncbi:MAG: flavodoxin family protein [bacterium]|nr:flavodoxin family protein [bacterium]